MLFLVSVTPHPGTSREVLFNEFQKTHTFDAELQKAIDVKRALKIVGRDEICAIIRAENLIFLEQALSPLEKKADIRVTPVVELWKPGSS